MANRQQKRDGFSPGVKRKLQARVGGHCSQCRRSTLGPNGDPERETCTGNAAHIAAAAPDGPRYDPTMTPEQRSSIHNGIWLCATCHNLVDKDWRTYGVDVFHAWKADAEAAARAELEGARPQSLSERESWKCGWCGTLVEKGLRVCLGCHAEVAHGSTRLELAENFQFGSAGGGILGIVLSAALPDWVLLQLGMQLGAPQPGHVWMSLGMTGGLALAGGCCFAVWRDRWHRKRPPRFIRSSLIG
jgi:hypothetical protein